MKTLFILSLVTALPLMAQDGDSASHRDAGRDDIRARLIKKFDKDGDGKLNDEEKAAMDEFVREHKKKRGEGASRGERRPHSKAGRESHEDLIKRFDKDEDGKLNDEEKAAMREEMSKRHQGKERRGKKRPGAEPQPESAE